MGRRRPLEFAALLPACGVMVGCGPVEEELGAIIRACLDGDVAVGPGLVRLLMHAEDPAAARRALDHADHALTQDTAQRLNAMRAALEACPDAWDNIHRVLDAVSHDPAPATAPADRIAGFAAAFDRAVAAAPEASVALHSLGDPDRLAAMTEEIVQKMAEWGLLGPGKAALEIGCGIGRFQAALAGRIGRCIGTDISVRMIAEAKRRCAGLPGVEFRVGSGQDLAGFDDSSLDLVFAVDSFPYLGLAGEAIVRRHFEETARILKPGGDFLILNFSYAGDDRADRATVHRLAAECGFRVLTNGERPFTLWDGTVHRLCRPPAAT